MNPPIIDPADPAQWLATPLGEYLLERERAYLDRTVADIFGYNAMQLGLPGFDLLRANRMQLKFTVGRESGAALRADGAELPVASNSIDLMLLPHALEFTENPHQILREAERVLVPDGHLIITCFNPMSLWGVARAFAKPDAYPWHGRFIHLLRIKDWLALLGFEMAGGAMGCYVPPCTTPKWLRRWGFMDAAGDRWWPFSGAVAYLHAVKRVRGMRVITPQWRHGARKPYLVAVPQKREEQTAARQPRTTRDDS